MHVFRINDYGKDVAEYYWKIKGTDIREGKKSTFRKSCSHDLSRHRVPLPGQLDRMRRRPRWPLPLQALEWGVLHKQSRGHQTFCPTRREREHSKSRGSKGPLGNSCTTHRVWGKHRGREDSRGAGVGLQQRTLAPRAPGDRGPRALRVDRPAQAARQARVPPPRTNIPPQS